jgi:hypothetical protein
MSDSSSEASPSGRSLLSEFIISVSASELSFAESELSNEDSESLPALVGSVVGGTRFHLRKMGLNCLSEDHVRK